MPAGDEHRSDDRGSAGTGTVHRGKEAAQLVLVQESAGADAAADVDAEGADLANGVRDVAGVEPAGEEDWDGDRLAGDPLGGGG
jgi:hypothetical protein